MLSRLALLPAPLMGRRLSTAATLNILDGALDKNSQGFKVRTAAYPLLRCRNVLHAPASQLVRRLFPRLPAVGCLAWRGTAPPPPHVAGHHDLLFLYCAGCEQDNKAAMDVLSTELRERLHAIRAGDVGGGCLLDVQLPVCEPSLCL
jgi:hypothetical protein